MWGYKVLNCYYLPNKFVAGCMITKLPSSWRNFTTILKRMRKKILFEILIASLDTEQKARVKSITGKGGEVQSTVNTLKKYPEPEKKGKKKTSLFSTSMSRLLP
jgi:hypothetical protein